jgi:hypothetical protein
VRGLVVVVAMEFLERRLVSQVQEEQGPVRRYLLHQPYQHVVPGFERHGPVVDRPGELVPELVEAHVQRHQDLVLGCEVVVERRLCRADALCDLPHAGAVESLIREEFQRHVEDALLGAGPGRGLVRGQGAAHGGLTSRGCCSRHVIQST